MAKPRHVVKVVSATEAKNRFGEIIKAASLRDEHLIVERDGVPVIAIIPIADYQQNFAAEATDTNERRTQARVSLAEFMQQIHSQLPDFPEDEVEIDIAEAVRAVRASQ